jgi:hypothetical protein
VADDLKKSGPADRARVNLQEEHEVRYWCKEFNCSENELREAAQTVGPMAADIGTFIAARRLRRFP